MISNNYIALIGTLGTQELVVIFIILLLLFGSKKLPQLARGVGKSMGEFKKAREEFEHEITSAEEEVTNRAKPSERTKASEKSESREEES